MGLIMKLKDIILAAFLALLFAVAVAYAEPYFPFRA